MSPLTPIQQRRLAGAIAQKSGGRLSLKGVALSQPQAILLWRGVCRIFANPYADAGQSPQLTPFEQARFRRAMGARSGGRLDCSLEPLARPQALALWDLVVRLSALDTSDDGRSGLGRAASVAALAAASLPLAACASLWGGNVKGSFSCSAPGGTCAPSTVIDDGALALIQSARPMTPAARPWSQPPMRGAGKVIAVADGVAHRERRVLKVVFPAFVDQRGYLHEPRIVHAVADQGGWMQTAERTELPALASIARQSAKAEPVPSLQPNDGAEPIEGQGEPPALAATAAAPSLGPSGLPDQAKVAAARQLGKSRLPTTPAEIKAAVAARLAEPSAKQDVGDAGGEGTLLAKPVEATDRAVQAGLAETGAQTSSEPARPVNAPARFPGHIEP